MAIAAIVISHLIGLGDVPPPLNSISFEGPDGEEERHPAA